MSPEESKPTSVDAGSSRPVLPEYETAVSKLFHTVVNTFMRAQNPVLDRIPTENVSHLADTSAEPDVAIGAHAAPIAVEMRALFSFEAVYTVDVDTWVSACWETASNSLHELMPQIYASMDRVLERSGRTVSKKGKPFSWDTVIDTLETMDIEFDENGQASGLTVVVHPDNLKKMLATPRTPEQDKRWADVMERKREAFHATRRRRTLD